MAVTVDIEEEEPRAARGRKPAARAIKTSEPITELTPDHFAEFASMGLAMIGATRPVQLQEAWVVPKEECKSWGDPASRVYARLSPDVKKMVSGYADYILLAMATGALVNGCMSNEKILIAHYGGQIVDRAFTDQDRGGGDRPSPNGTAPPGSPELDPTRYNLPYNETR